MNTCMIRCLCVGKDKNRQEVTGKGRRGEGEQTVAVTGVGSVANGAEKTGRFWLLIIP